MSVDPKSFRKALGQFATGVTVITTRDDQGRPVGVTASSFNSVSLEPPLVLWSLDKSAASLSAFSSHGYFAVHVLAAGQEKLSNNFARRGEDKFAGVECAQGLGAVPVLPECAACFQCRLTYQYEGGDHVIFVGEVLQYDNFDRRPLIFHSGSYAGAKPRMADEPAPERAFDVNSGGGFGPDFLGYLLSRTHYGLHQPLLREAAGMGLQEIHYFVLSILCINNPLSLEKCAGFLAHTGLAPTISDCLEMEQLGLLTVTSDGEDILSITESGRSRYLRLLAADISRQKQALADFKPEELSEFMGYLRRLVEKTSPGVPDIWS